MSGTYQLDGSLFTKNPLAKRWQRQQIARSGVGESIYSDFWQIELSFGILSVADDIPFFEARWFAGGLHTAVLPHPETGNLTGFTGVNIAEFNYEFNDVEADSWADGGRLLLDHISLSATGTV
jgi:hypothetical protein